jgi:hypothetical protein
MESAGLGLYRGLENITCVFSYGFCLLLCNLACGRGRDSRIYLDHRERDKGRSLFTPFTFLSQTFLVRWHDGPRERSWEGVEACLG